MSVNIGRVCYYVLSQEYITVMHCRLKHVTENRTKFQRFLLYKQRKIMSQFSSTLRASHSALQVNTYAIVCFYNEETILNNCVCA